MLFPTWRKPMALGTVILVGATCAAAWWGTVQLAAYVLAGGLALAAIARLTMREKDVLTVRSRGFDVALLLAFALALVLLAPWGLSDVPG